MAAARGRDAWLRSCRGDRLRKRRSCYPPIVRIFPPGAAIYRPKMSAFRDTRLWSSLLAFILLGVTWRSPALALRSPVWGDEDYIILKFATGLRRLTQRSDRPGRADFSSSGPSERLPLLVGSELALRLMPRVAGSGS